MTYAQLIEIRAALMDIRGWLRDTLDAGVFLLMLTVAGLALFNASRGAVM